MPKQVSDRWREQIETVNTEILPTDTILPLDNYNNNSPIVFRIRQVPNFAIDTKNIKLLFDFKVQKLNAANAWGDIALRDNIVPENGFGFTLWSDVHLSIGGTLLTSPEYPRTSHFKNIFFKSMREQQSLEPAMYYRDDPIAGDAVYQSSRTNLGGFLRGQSIKTGKIKSVTTPIYVDVFQSPGYFPDTVSCELRLFMAKPELCLLQDPENDVYVKTRVVITSAKLLIPRFRMPGLSKTMTTNYESCRVLSFINPKGMASFNKSFNSLQIPHKIAIAVMTEERWNGKENKSPLYIEDCGVSNISVKVNDQMYPTQYGMNVDGGTKYYNEPYGALFEGFGAIAPPFTYSTVDNGYVIFPVMLTPSQQDEKQPMFGAADINISFKTATTENMMILIFCYYNDTFTIDKHGRFQSSFK